MAFCSLRVPSRHPRAVLACGAARTVALPSLHKAWGASMASTMASASPPSRKAAGFAEAQEEEETMRRQIERWRSELSNLSAERSRLQQWRARQVAQPPPQPCRSRPEPGLRWPADPGPDPDPAPHRDQPESEEAPTQKRLEAMEVRKHLGIA